MDRPHVLVVEDRPAVLKLMATILAESYEVTTAADGATALRLVGDEPFDVVLTDIRMPGASGFDVLRAARAAGRRGAVVMMTAYANVTDAVAAIKLGAFDYVAKPLDADEVLLAVARAVEHLRERADARAEEPAADADTLTDFRHAVEDARDRASRAYLRALLRDLHGNVTGAAIRAGMTRESLHRLLRRYGLRSEDYKPHGADALAREGTGDGGGAGGEDGSASSAA